jgi:hypothetical protein
MRLTLDSCVWERMFEPEAEQNTALRPILDAIRFRQISAFISDAALRIEAVPKKRRASYFASVAPFFGPIDAVERDGRLLIRFSLMPDNRLHPGIPEVQAPKLEVARELGVELMRGLPWISLPKSNCSLEYVAETETQRGCREQIQLNVFHDLAQRGVGKARFDSIIDHLDLKEGRIFPGWSGLDVLDSERHKGLIRACAEWADAELISAHVGYGNDLLCTLDFYGAPGQSAFATDHRMWLANHHKVRFITVSELGDLLESQNDQN